MIKVSVIVPIYNVEQYLARCLDSLANQTLDDMEFILVDDRSTDSSPEIADDHAKQNSKFKVIHKKVNEGLGEARNTGLRYANGEYIAFLDSDDYVEKETYEICYKNAKSKNVDTVIFGYTNDTPKGTVVHSKEKYAGVYRGTEIKEKLFPLVIGTLPNDPEDYAIGFAPCWQIYRSQLLKDNHIRFVSERKYLYEDMMFALDLYQFVDSTMVISDPMYHYVSNPGSLTKKIDPEKFSKLKELYLYLKNTRSYSSIIFENPDILIRFQRIMISYIRLCVMQLSYDKKYYDKIKDIIRDEVSEEVIKYYPVNRLPFKQRIFALCLKYKLVKLAYVLTSVYNKRKEQS